MADFALARESIEEMYDWPVLISDSESRAEQRRLITGKPVIGFRISSPALTYAGMSSYRAFVVDNYGPHTTFTLTSPFDETSYTVRLEPGSFRTNYARGVFRCEFEVKVVDA